MAYETKKVDVLVIGSGGAGSSAAREAADLGASVLVVSKDPIVCSDSKISEGIVTVRASGLRADTEQNLADNVRIQGDDISSTSIVKRFARDSRSAYQWLRTQGLKPATHTKLGEPQALNIPMGGHTHARSVDHQNGGLDYAHACWNALNQSNNIEYLEDAWLLDLFVSSNDENKVGGGLIYRSTRGQFLSVRAKAVIIASGGLSTLYFPNTDTMRGNTGDSYAIAARAGAQLVDMEQVQFIPFSVAAPPSYQGLVVGEPVLAGAMGVIRDNNGNVIQRGIMSKTRAQCAAVIARAVANGQGTENGGCYLDLTGNTRGQAGDAYVALMNDKIGGILKIVRGAMGVDAAKFKQPWEVKPSAHYLMGGVCANENGNALDQQGNVIAGLYVAGQALGGLHGSNRLGSTSLAEAIVFGRTAGKHAAKHSRSINDEERSEFDISEARLIDFYNTVITDNHSNDASQSPIALIRKLQATCWQGIGPAREERAMYTTLERVKALKSQLQNSHVEKGLVWNQTFIDYVECRNLLFVAECISKSALARTESIGAHVRLDDKAKSFTLLRSPPFSIVCNSDQKDIISVDKLTRQASPFLSYLKLMLSQKTKALFLTLVSFTPQWCRDVVLTRIYQQALNSQGEK